MSDARRSALFRRIHPLRTRPFQWGEVDCAQLARHAIEAMTGKAPEIPKYENRKEALRLISDAGGLTALVSSYLGRPHQGRPRVGDVVMLEDGALGVFMGPDILTVGEHGFAMMNESSIVEFWAVD